MNISKIQTNTTVKIGSILITSLLLGLHFDYLFYNKLPGINFLIYIMSITFGLFTISYIFKREIKKDILYLLIPLLFFSTMIFIRTSVTLTLLNMLMSLILSLLIAKTLYERKIEEFLINDFIKIVFLPLEFLSPLFQTLSKLFSSNHKSKVISQVLKGVVLAIPLLFLFGLLFFSADLIFQRYISDLVTINIHPETIFRSILILIVTLIFIGAYSYIFQKLKEKAVTKDKEEKYLIGKIESSVVLGLVNTLFLLFVLVQLTYLFGGEGNISVQGFTYAEYARRGFFELIAVAIISLLLLLALDRYVVKNKKIHMLGFKILSTLMIVQVIVIMVSAFTRLLLYERAYGFTTLRLYSHSFIIFLAVVFCLLIYKIYRDRRESKFAMRVFILIVLYLVGMNFLNPDLFIAQRNIERFTATGKLDVYYLANLSDDATKEVVNVLDILEGDMRMSLGNKLYWRFKMEDDLDDWQSFNISRRESRCILESKMEELEEYKDYEEGYF